MTQPGKRLLHGAALHVQAVLADLGGLTVTVLAFLVVGVLLVVLAVLAAATTWLLVVPALPTLLVLPIRYLSPWMPTWLALIVTLATWLAVVDEALRLVDVAGRARVRRLAASLAACADMGAAASATLKQRVRRVVQARLSSAVDDLELDEAARWLSAEDALDAGDYRAVAATLAQSARPAAAGVTSVAARLRRWLRLAAVGAVVLVLVGALGVPSLVRDTCLSCGPRNTQEHRLWP